MFNKYFMPTKLLMKKGIVSESEELFKVFGKKALIVTGKHSSKVNGSLDDVINVLKKINIDFVIFDEVEENPSVETVVKASDKGKKENVDFIIGIGGGSPIDAAKAIAIMIKNKEVTAENLFTNKKLEGIDIVAVPTTSGTGTETTQYAILTDHKEKTKRNLGQEIFPKVALVDPTYTMGMGINGTRSTAVDALSHIVEGYLNSNANAITDGLAEKALEIWGKAKNGLMEGNLSYEDRENLMLASTMAGVIIAQVGTSLPHGMGYHLTYFKKIAHGYANCCLYKEYLKVFKDKTKVDKIYKLLGFNNSEEFNLMMDKLVVVDIDITEEEMRAYAEAMVSNEAKLKNHPEKISFEEIYNIYKNSFNK